MSLILVPLTLGYLDAYEYGVWITLNSVLTWINANLAIIAPTMVLIGVIYINKQITKFIHYQRQKAHFTPKVYYECFSSK